MDLLDANILIGTFRMDDPDHTTLKGWLEEALNQGALVTFPPLVEVAFLRIVTHLDIFVTPSSFEEAVEFLQALHESGQFRETRGLCGCAHKGGGGVAISRFVAMTSNDAFLAATAAEARCRLVSRDGGFSRIGWGGDSSWLHHFQLPPKQPA